MSELMTRSPMALPDIGITVRPATMADIPFIDSLQKLHTKQVGWMPTATFEGKIRLGHVLIAEEVGGGQKAEGRIREEDEGADSFLPSALCPPPTPIGYLIGNDQYFKRDDLGVIYQMNVLPGKQRGLVGATLLKAQFERSAYGCKLYCCWCAQDIAANRFWEAMGFVPLAFRAGSEKKSRTHIFWQKRIREGDTTTPWWFPSKTAGGSIREDRIVLPIPPGTHWSDAKPLIFPESPEQLAAKALPETRRVGESVGHAIACRNASPKRKTARHSVPDAESANPPIAVRRNGLSFDIPQPGEALPVVVPATDAVAKTKAPKPPRVKRVCDPRLVSAARELRDRWLEQVNDHDAAAPPMIGCEKYGVSRAIGDSVTIEAMPMKLLAA